MLKANTSLTTSSSGKPPEMWTQEIRLVIRGHFNSSSLKEPISFPLSCTESHVKNGTVVVAPIGQRILKRKILDLTPFPLNLQQTANWELSSLPVLVINFTKFHQIYGCTTHPILTTISSTPKQISNGSLKKSMNMHRITISFSSWGLAKPTASRTPKLPILRI